MIQDRSIKSLAAEDDLKQNNEIVILPKSSEQSSLATSIKTSIEEDALMELAQKGLDAKTPDLHVT